MEATKQLETESEGDREASSCGSPSALDLMAPGNNMEGGSSENDKDFVDQSMLNADDEHMQHNLNVQQSTPSSMIINNSDNNNSDNTFNNSNNSGTPVYHASRSSAHIGRKPAFGQSCSMKTLLEDGILQAGEKVLTLEYEGSKFFGDLRKDGTIQMCGPDDKPHVYATPVAWANHCCRLLNPASKPLNAWSSIRFKGKRLDSYKLKWYRAQKKPNTMNNTGNMNMNNNNNIANMIAGVNMNFQNNALNSSIIRNLQQQQQHQQQHQQQQHQQQQHMQLNHQQQPQLQQQLNQQGGSRLVVHNPITSYFPQYENPIKNKKLIKSVLISNNMDNDCKRLVAKSLDLSVDPCLFSQQMNSNNTNDTNNNSSNNNVIDNDNDADDNNIDESDPNTSNANDTNEPNSNNGNDVDTNNADLNNTKGSNNISNNNPDDNPDNNNDDSIVNHNHCTTLRTTVINYEQLGTRGPHNTHNQSTMVKCIPFSAVERIQPFNVTISTNALLLVDFHCHLVSGEVAGYLAGSWDFGQHILTVTQAFPCRTSLSDEASAAAIEEEIRQDIEKRNLTLVGWYHSHQGKYSNHPTIRDIQNQLEFQITMKESASAGYIPCIGLICSPHDIRTEDDLSPSFQVYWVMPPPEHLLATNHYGRPMQMYYSVTRDLFLTQDLLLEMRLLANHYTSKANEMVDFKSIYQHNDRVSNLDKLSASIKPKLPKDLQESEYPDEPAIWKAAVDHFWKFLRNLVIPPIEEAQDQQEEHIEEAPDQQEGQLEEQDREQQEEEQQEEQQEVHLEEQQEEQLDEQQDEERLEEQQESKDETIN